MRQSKTNFLLCSIALVGVVLILVVVFLLQRTEPQSAIPKTPPTAPSGQSMLPTKTVTIGSTTLLVEVATTPEQEERGLSGRPGLAEGTGMVFIFDPTKTPGFWMKDMRFSLDIIFAKADGTIITIHPNVSPATYPQVFRPSEPVRYVLEVPAGFAGQHDISVGQKMMLQNQ